MQYVTCTQLTPNLCCVSAEGRGEERVCLLYRTLLLLHNPCCVFRCLVACSVLLALLGPGNPAASPFVLISTEKTQWHSQKHFN